MTTGYVIFIVDGISDPARLDTYKKAAHPTIRDAGGRVTIGYGRQEVVEGAPMVGVVQVEFSSFEAAQTWYHSEAYKEAAALRQGAATCRAVIVEGRE